MRHIAESVRDLSRTHHKQTGKLRLTMADFHATYPDYEETSKLDELRAAEYCYLDESRHVYLDYTGAGLAARSQLQAHEARISAGCFGNPHSDNPTSSASTRLVEEARAAVLRHFHTTADD